MNLSFYIARRYLFSKKSHNAINIISMVSVCGIALATAALICILSAFNGFSNVVTQTFSVFDPDLKITPAKGKVFDPTTADFEKIKKIDGIDIISESLEENALLKYHDRQEAIVLKGVSEHFKDIAQVDKFIIDGEFLLRDGNFDYGVIGAELAVLLQTRAGYTDPVELYMPRRDAKIQLANPSNAFSVSDVYISGVFALNQQGYDNIMFIVSIDLVRELLGYKTEVSSLDIKIKEGYSVNAIKKEISEIIGPDYKVKDRFEQQDSLYKMINAEKWVAFFIFAFITLIAIFNVVGSLSMLILEKNEDIGILKSLGARKNTIISIFIFEGWLITFIGALIGLLAGVIICLIQQHFGLLKLGSGGAFVIDSYPVLVKFTDILTVFLVVNLFGYLAVLYPVNVLRKRI